ncbi:hypothetical protein [Terribacillus sp. DMT04]|uniref:hypothetical protein n=1 Tax=Terribacillus sp. DMT04 TaxID=2850441 RepID=UPI001C2C9106|nr:hypothetical protein [Terribacillus sp. DMT04]QXE00596.1 hypothetical protein KS242_11245 [Terribacillus sp. DMT04]
MYLDETKRYRFIESVPYGKYFMVRIYDLELQEEYTVTDWLLSKYTDKALKEFYLQIKRDIFATNNKQEELTSEMGDMQQRLFDFLDEEDEDDLPVSMENVIPFPIPASNADK